MHAREVVGLKNSVGAKSAPVEAKMSSFEEKIPGGKGARVVRRLDGVVMYTISETGEKIWNEQILQENRECEARIQKRRSDLVWALRTRILTLEEMKEVEAMGPSIFVTIGIPYFPEELNRMFNELLLQQFRLRLAAERNAGGGRL